MHRIDTSTATSDGLFTEGDPLVPTPATVVSADWLNAVQEEIVNTLSAAGIAPNKTDNTQLVTAIGIISGAGRLQKSWTLSAAVAPGGTLTLPDSMQYVVGADVLMLACDGVILDKDNYSEVGTPGSLSSSVTLSFTAPSGSRMLAVLLATSGVGSSVSGGVSDETIAAINEAIARANAAAAAAETAAAAAGDPIYVTPTEANA